MSGALIIVAGGACFPHCARLTGRNAFADVFSQSIRSSDYQFTVLARFNTLAYPRLGLAISRKVAKSAVARNRIKRVIRESFRCHRSEISGLDCVVIGHVGLMKQNSAVLFTALQRHWRKLAGLCAPS